MSDIVLKDKSGVKNTYSDIETINIPDGNGGFVKYSLGGTPLPEYDGTVIIEKAESVLGLRRFKESVVPDGNDYDVGKLVGNESYIQNVWDTSFIEINPITKTIEDITVTVLGFTTFFVSTNSAYPDSPLTLVKTHVSEGDKILFFTTSFAEIISGTEILPSLANGFDVLSTANSTVDEWLLDNTEGVSV